MSEIGKPIVVPEGLSRVLLENNALRAENERLRVRLHACEVSLNVYDDAKVSEYWERYPDPIQSAVAGTDVIATNDARFKGGVISEKCPKCGRHDPECLYQSACHYAVAGSGESHGK